MKRQKTIKCLRASSGSAICDFGAAFWLITIGFMFPVMQLLSLFATYASCWVLNETQCEQAALVTQADKQGYTVITQQIPEAWRNLGLGKFVQLASTPNTNVNYQGSVLSAANGPSATVCVCTNFQVNPFISIPALGLDKPLNFSISTQRLVEDPNALNN